MPKDQTSSDPRKTFAPRYLPLLIAGVMLLVYCCTLNHWVTLLNVLQVATTSGWVWHPQISNPLTFLIVLPFRLLPAAQVPLAMNVFSALCGAATLAVLARSVAILPHDRTEMERMRERSDFAFLTGWVAWIPPMVAVFFVGLQLGFWENATSWTGESFEILWFAVIVWQLLEYRLDESELRLYLTSFLYGAGLTENWAMFGFTPIFLVVIIWLRKLDFFNLNFLVRMTACFLAGLLFFLLLPLVAKYSTNAPIPFWEVLKFNLKSDWTVIHLATNSDIRKDLALLSLTSLLPALAMSIRWSAGFGDSSRLGSTLVNYVMHIVNALLLGVIIWTMFDPPFSPTQLIKAITRAPGLTVFYIGGLCIGYYSGYLLLIFGRSPIPTRRNVRPETVFPKSLMWLSPVIVGCMFAAILVLGGLLVYRNIPLIHAANSDLLKKYAQFSTRNLPSGGAVLFCDNFDLDQTLPIRAHLLEAVLAQKGHAENYPVVDTSALNDPAYHRFLHRHYPTIWPEAPVSANDSSISYFRLLQIFDQISKKTPLYYLNPSFGYYFERYYMEPHGLNYAMKVLPGESLLPPNLDTNLIQENETFWKQLLAETRPAIERGMNPVDLRWKPGLPGWILVHLHIGTEQDPNSIFAGTIYSRGLNYLGVQFQRAGELEKAAALFTNAIEFNSNNVVASVNLEFNKSLRAGSPAGVNLSHVTTDLFGKYRNWNDVMDANGPFDETSFCFENGVSLVQAGLMGQAASQFDRVRELAPNNLPTRLFLGRIYTLSHLPDRALEALHDPMTNPSRFGLTDFNSTEMNLLVATAYFQKDDPSKATPVLRAEMQRHPDDDQLLLFCAQIFNMHHLYTNALETINRKLDRSPNDPSWVYGKGYVCLQIGEYDEAVKALTHFLELQTNSPEAMFYRGVAQMQAGRLDAARADFLQLQGGYENNLQVAYNLGDIAWRQHQTNEVIRNYHIILANAPTNAVELNIIKQRLSDLGSN